MQLTVQNQTFNGNEIVARSGKVTGHRFELGVGSISALRKQMRADGISANEASQNIAAMLKNGKGDLAYVQVQAALIMARGKGMFPTGFEIRNKSFVIRGASVPEPKTKAVKAAPAISEADKAKLDLLKDLTPEQVKAALEMLK